MCVYVCVHEYTCVYVWVWVCAAREIRVFSALSLLLRYKNTTGMSVRQPCIHIYRSACVVCIQYVCM